MEFTQEIPPPPRVEEVSDEGGVLGTTELPASTELLAYYRTRITEFEKERAEFIARTSSIEVSHEELHRTQWELRVRHEEIAELQRALSDANVYLFDEREQVLKLQAENDQLKIQELEDRRRIQHLLALTQPVSQEVTFFRDCRPAKMTRFPVESSADGLRSRADGFRTGGSVSTSTTTRQAGGKASGHTTTGASSKRSTFGTSSRGASRGASRSGTSRGASRRSNGNGHSSSGGSTAATQPYKSRVLRTIYLPSEKADTLLLTVESLQKQLGGVKELEAGRNAALLEDRQKRNEEERARSVADREKIEHLGEQIRKTEEKMRQVTKTYLEQRHESKMAERVSKEETEMLRTQNQRLVAQLQEERRRFSVELEAVRNAAEQEAKVYTEQFRREALAREEDLSVLKEQVSGVWGWGTGTGGRSVGVRVRACQVCCCCFGCCCVLYLPHTVPFFVVGSAQHLELQRTGQAKINELETRLKEWIKKYSHLDSRRKMDFEGFNNDVVVLRKKMARMENAMLKPPRRRKGKRRLKNGSARMSGSRGGDMTWNSSTSAINSFVSNDGLSKLYGDAAVQPERLETDLRALRARIAEIEGSVDGYVAPPSLASIDRKMEVE
jgi:coiled-coil domain-containing protein 77